uniref:Uncharacterized protein n=1 Tax=Pyrodinium bahamense TaxID=73915 RepID=A0A7S0BCJ1_9DINO|mmetsp:Transcript_9271/g.26007  ORF Transcript_9271/g.26007 Transcript_9271/m.26007 type:complete len:175 (+) Transcript_9271:96-620(+)
MRRAEPRCARDGNGHLQLDITPTACQQMQGYTEFSLEDELASSPCPTPFLAPCQPDELNDPWSLAEVAPPPGTLEELTIQGSAFWHHGPCQGPRCKQCYKYECVACGTRRNGLMAPCRACSEEKITCSSEKQAKPSLLHVPCISAMASTTMVAIPSPSRAQLRQTPNVLSLKVA